MVAVLAHHLLHHSDRLWLNKPFVNAVNFIFQFANWLVLHAANRVIQYRMKNLQLKVFGELLAICQALLEINHQFHSFIELIMQEFEDFKDILADGHSLSPIIEHRRDIL